MKKGGYWPPARETVRRPDLAGRRFSFVQSVSIPFRASMASSDSS